MSEIISLSYDDSGDKPCGTQTTSSSDVTSTDIEPDGDETKSYDAVEDRDNRRWALAGDVAIELLMQVNCVG
jgi:hypothetical protein